MPMALSILPMIENIVCCELCTRRESINPRREKTSPAISINHISKLRAPQASPTRLNCLLSFSGFFEGASCIVVPSLLRINWVCMKYLVHRNSCVKHGLRPTFPERCSLSSAFLRCMSTSPNPKQPVSSYGALVSVAA